MKINKTFAVDLALAKLLSQEKNQSDLINKLLFKHYSEKSLKEQESTNKEEAEQEADKILEN